MELTAAHKEIFSGHLRLGAVNPLGERIGLTNYYLTRNGFTPQKPALQLYRKLGFQEVGLSFIDRYELVWLERRLYPQELSISAERKFMTDETSFS